MAIRQSPAARRARTIGDVTDLLSEYLQGKTEERQAATTKKEEKQYVVNYKNPQGQNVKKLVSARDLAKPGGMVFGQAEAPDPYEDMVQVTVTDETGTHEQLVHKKDLAAGSGIQTKPPAAVTEEDLTPGEQYEQLLMSNVTEKMIEDMGPREASRLAKISKTLSGFTGKAGAKEAYSIFEEELFPEPPEAVEVGVGEQYVNALKSRIGEDRYAKLDDNVITQIAALGKVTDKAVAKELYEEIEKFTHPPAKGAPVVKEFKMGGKIVTLSWDSKDGAWKQARFDDKDITAKRWKPDKNPIHFRQVGDTGKMQMYEMTSTGALPVGDEVGEEVIEKKQLVQVLDADGNTVWIDKADAEGKKTKKVKKPDKFWYYNPDTQEDEMHPEDADGTEKMVPRGKVGVYKPVSPDIARAQTAQVLKNKYKAEYDVMRQELNPEWAWYTEAGNTQVKNADTSFNRYFDRELKGKDPNNVQSRIEAKKNAYGKLSTAQKQNYDRIEAIKEKEAMLIKAMYQRRLGIDESVENKIFVYTSIEDFVVDNPQLNSVPLEKIQKHIDEARVKWLKGEGDIIIHIHDKVTARKGFLAVIGEIMGLSGG